MLFPKEDDNLMDERQKEIEKLLLSNESDVVDQLKQSYTTALADVKKRIQLLQIDEMSQSKIYQLEYQQSLEKQISAIIDVLKSDNTANINAYLLKTYKDGYIGTLYTMQGQGTPLIFPHDQAEMINCITNPIDDMTFSQRINQNMNDLKTTVKSEVSRGIANGSGYGEIAKQLSLITEEDFYKSYRIAVTEGGRVASEAKYSCMQTAKNKGADIVKQWDSTLDIRTRDAHAQLDGQIKELDEPFNVGGNEAQYPHGFGVAALDINCRCVVLERARWAVKGETSYNKWNNEDGGIINCSGFEDFKVKYLNILKETDIIKTVAKNGIQIKSISIHTLDKAKERGVDTPAVLNALEKPLYIGDIVTDELGRRSQRFIGQNATVNVNPDSGKITTVWKTGKAKVKKYTKKGD